MVTADGCFGGAAGCGKRNGGLFAGSEEKAAVYTDS